MRELFGDVIAISGVCFAVYGLLKNRIEWKGFSAMAIVCIVLGVAVSGMSRITQLNVKGGEVTLNIDRQVQQVETRAQEVEKLAADVMHMREDVTLILQNANVTNDKIADSEKRVMNLVNRADATEASIKRVKTEVDGTLKMAEAVQSAVAKMESNVRGMFRSLFESFAYTIMTRNIFPTPQPIAVKIDEALNRVAQFAIPDGIERQAVFQGIVADVQSARPQIPQRPRPNQGK
jgi:ABC-type transporter Mla subunit MlaD